MNQYIQHRLEISGAKGAPYFTRPALWRIFKYSKGIPRLVNAICDKALLAGYVQQREKIDYRTVGLAIQGIGREHSRMSLINDALKRAKDAQQKSPPSAPGPQFRPAGTRRRKREASDGDDRAAGDCVIRSCDDRLSFVW